MGLPWRSKRWDPPGRLQTTGTAGVGSTPGGRRRRSSSTSSRQRRRRRERRASGARGSGGGRGRSGRSPAPVNPERGFARSNGNLFALGPGATTPHYGEKIMVGINIIAVTRAPTPAPSRCWWKETQGKMPAHRRAPALRKVEAGSVEQVAPPHSAGQMQLNPRHFHTRP